MSWFIVSAKYFTAAGDYDGNKVVRAAPIIKYMIGWPMVKVSKYCNTKGWHLEYHDRA